MASFYIINQEKNQPLSGREMTIFNLKYDSPPQRAWEGVCVSVRIHTQSYELYLLLYLPI